MHALTNKIKHGVDYEWHCGIQVYSQSEWSVLVSQIFAYSTGVQMKCNGEPGYFDTCKSCTFLCPYLCSFVTSYPNPLGPMFKFDRCL